MKALMPGLFLYIIVVGGGVLVVPRDLGSALCFTGYFGSSGARAQTQVLHPHLTAPTVLAFCVLSLAIPCLKSFRQSWGAYFIK